MMKTLKLFLAIAALFAAAGCAGTMPPMNPMDAEMVTGRNWNCPPCYK